MNMNRNFGRVPGIEDANRRFGGFLDLFAKLPPANQEIILKRIAELKQQIGANPEAFLLEVKALARMYGALIEGSENQNTEKTLGVRLADLEKAAEGLNDARTMITSKN